MSAESPKKHYTLSIEVSETTPPTTVYKDTYDKTGKDIPRQVREVTRLVIRDKNLNTLLTRAAGHLDLIEDGV